MADPVTCPKPGCGALATFVYDEVDIGVGVLQHIYGATCEQGHQLVSCSICGVWEWMQHAAWCPKASPRMMME